MTGNDDKLPDVVTLEWLAERVLQIQGSLTTMHADLTGLGYAVPTP